jgi:sigma-E factor negative regulatory protein RseB
VLVSRIHSRRVGLLIGLVLACSSVLADEAMTWIQTMSNAMQNLNYRGTFVYMHENQLETMSISHIRNASGEKERLLSLNGEAREVIRDDKNLTCIWPSSRKVVVDFSRQNSYSPIFIPEDISRLAKYYKVEMLEPGRIADQFARVLHIKPLDEFRYGMKFWISEESGLMMKSAMINEHGEMVEQVMFTHLELIPEEEQILDTIIPGLDDGYNLIRYHSGNTSVNLEGDSAWQLDQIPAGFWQESSIKRPIPGTEQFVQQLIFTDGLASLSVFIEKSGNLMHQQLTSMGAVNAYIHMYKDFSVTAIGEVPAMTVKFVAEAMSYNKP